MSKTTWTNCKTTIGHGVNSQYGADHYKEWVARETRWGGVVAPRNSFARARRFALTPPMHASRKQDRSASPDKLFSNGNSFLRSSLFAPLEGEPIEHRHHAATKSLSDLRQLQAAPASGSHTTERSASPSKLTSQPLAGGKYLPHLSHHHHFGWNPPTPQVEVAAFDNKKNFYRYGSAQAFNQNVACKAAVISTRRA